MKPLVILFSIIALSCSAQNSTDYNHLTDSLKSELDELKTDNEQKVEQLYKLSRAHFSQGEYDISAEYANEMLDMSKKIDYLQGEIEAKGMIANYALVRGNHEEAIEIYYEQLRLIEKEKDHKLANLYQVHFNLGRCHRDRLDWKKSEKEFKEALAFSTEAKDTFDMLGAIGALSGIALNQNDTLTAREFGTRAVEIAEQWGDKEEVAIRKCDLALTFDPIENFKKIETLQLEAIEDLKKAGSFFNEIVTMYNLMYTYFINGKLDKAIQYGKKCLEKAEAIDHHDMIFSAHEALHETYSAYGKDDLAYKHLLITYELNNKNLNAEKEKAILEIETKYETEKKEQENKILKQDIAIRKKDAKLKNRLIYGMSISGFFILLSSFLWFKKYKARKEAEKREAELELEKYSKEIDVLRASINSRLDEPQNNESVGISLEHLNNHLNNPLTKREFEVLDQLGYGKSNKEISEELFVSVNTIKTHLLSIYTKLDVSNRTQATQKFGTLLKKAQ